MSDWTEFLPLGGQKIPTTQLPGTSSEVDSNTEQQQGLFPNSMNGLLNAAGKAGITIDNQNNRIILNDGSNNRIIIGKIS